MILCFVVRHKIKLDETKHETKKQAVHGLVRLSWLENAWSRSLLDVLGIFSSKVCHTDLVFDVGSGFTSRFVHTRLHCPYALFTICATMVDPKLDFYTLRSVTLKSRSNLTLFCLCNHVKCTYDANLVVGQVLAQIIHISVFSMMI